SLGDHAAIAHEDDVVDAKALAELLDLRLQGARIPGVSLEDLDGNGATLRVAEQTEVDLQLPFLPVSGVAELGEWAIPPLDVGRAEVVENDTPLVEVLLGEGSFDIVLTRP